MLESCGPPSPLATCGSRMPELSAERGARRAAGTSPYGMMPSAGSGSRIPTARASGATTSAAPGWSALTRSCSGPVTAPVRSPSGRSGLTVRIRQPEDVVAAFGAPR